jgi:hypothetical protein
MADGEGHDRKVETEIYTVEIDRLLSSGIAISEHWKMNGKLHRVDGAAVIWRDGTTGVVKKEYWLRHGEPHREDGPAYIKRKGDTGRVYYSVWYQDGKHIDPPRRGKGPVRKPPTSDPTP